MRRASGGESVTVASHMVEHFCECFVRVSKAAPSSRSARRSRSSPVEVEPDSGLLPRIVHPRLFRKRLGVGTDLDDLGLPLLALLTSRAFRFDQLIWPSTGDEPHGGWFFESNGDHLFLSRGVAGMSSMSDSRRAVDPSSLDDVAVGSSHSS